MRATKFDAVDPFSEGYDYSGGTERKFGALTVALLAAFD
jgi:hypothetical protein